MYSRQPMGRFPKGMRVPENYSGNAFAPRPAPFIEEQVDSAEMVETAETAEALSSRPSDIEAGADSNDRSDHSRPTFKFDLGRFFSGNRGFGMEEFLIIALILLLAQNGSGDDTLIFLILLLFIR